jgi:SulP family sulfate permease
LHFALLSLRLPRYNWTEDFKSDLLSAVTISLFGIPQGISYARIAGLPPQYGLYCNIFPQLVYGLFGQSKHGAVGVMSSPALMLGLVISKYADAEADPGKYASLAMLITFQMAMLFILMSLFKLGYFVEFISRPVFGGFSAGATLLVWAGMSADLLGVHVPKTTSIVTTLGNVIGEVRLGHHDTWSIVFGLSSIVLLKLLSKWDRCKKVPVSLVVILLALVASSLLRSFDIVNGEELEVVGDIPSAVLPPTLSFLTTDDHFWDILSSTPTIALVVFLESMAVAKNYALQHAYEVEPDAELFAVGMANAVGACFSCFPTGAAFGRSAVNAQNARSQLSLMLSGLVVLLFMLTLASLFSILPKSAIAGVIVVAVANQINLQEFKYYWLLDKVDFAVMLLSAALTCVLGAQIGVLVAAVASVLKVFHMQTSANVVEVGRVGHSEHYRALVEKCTQCLNSIPSSANVCEKCKAKVSGTGAERVDGVLIIAFGSAIFFANAHRFRAGVISSLRERAVVEPTTLNSIVIDCRSINAIDASGIQAIEEVGKLARGQGMKLVLAHVSPLVLSKIYIARKAKWLIHIDGIFRSLHSAAKYVLPNLKDPPLAPVSLQELEAIGNHKIFPSSRFKTPFGTGTNQALSKIGEVDRNEKINSRFKQSVELSELQSADPLGGSKVWAESRNKGRRKQEQLAKHPWISPASLWPAPPT